MPTPYPKEFRRDVVAVARRGEQTKAQVARSFGISESCLARWLVIADREEGLTGPQPQASGPDEAAMRELLKRNKQLEQENEILRRATAYFARDALPK
jgi:transposase